MTFDRHRRRLLAAPAALAAPWFVRHALAAETERFALGIASGSPQAASVVLWTRLTGPDLPGNVSVQWELAEDEAFTRIVARGSEQAQADSAHSVHAEPAGLAPGRWYWYRFSALGQRSRAGRTRTLPAAGAVEPLRFAIASCQRWEHGLWAAWRQAADDDLDLVLFLGDYIYESGIVDGTLRAHDGPAARTLEQYRNRYALYKSDPLLQRVHERAPWIMVWDDHEVENDYAGLQSETLDPDFAARRAAAYQAYWEHMPFPRRVLPAAGAGWRISERYDWGRLARIVTLDDRQFRDPQVCPKPGRGGSNTVLQSECSAILDPRRTLLGAAQEQWLAEQWRAPEGGNAPWNLLAQQTLMARLNWIDPAKDGKGDALLWTDGWDGYPAARERLLQGVQQRGAKNVVVLGGDVHAHYAADIHARAGDPASPVVASEFCGTSISSKGMAQSRLDGALPFNPHIRYGRADQRGYVRLALDAKALTAELMAVADPRDAASAVGVAARFVVESGRAGPQKA